LQWESVGNLFGQVDEGSRIVDRGLIDSRFFDRQGEPMNDNSSMAASAPREIDPKWYRQVLAQYPTGVCVVTSVTEHGEPIAMIVGSFSSVSLNPPLVAFFPSKDSSSWAKLRPCRSFCVNILASDQEKICRKLASKDADKFAGTPHRFSSAGNPILDGVVAWIDCLQHSVSEAGDHDIVLGQVLELDVVSKQLPLLFFQGGYGRFSPASLAAMDSPIISQPQLQLVDRARPFMEDLASEVAASCIASLRIGVEVVVAASAGTPQQDLTPMLIGQRLPFLPPTGAVFAAWLPEQEAQKWLGDSHVDRRAEEYRLQLDTVRARGYSLGLRSDAQRAFVAKLSQLTNSNYEAHHPELQQLIAALAYDPLELSPSALAAVRLISVPIFDNNARPIMALTLHGFSKPDVLHNITRVRAVARDVTMAIGGRDPTVGP
jgi:flavin reductase (DIM6/NTAB) family NADH-FMN oxidoreductase RutF/DNA-binding IclR family transcriptional regulator